MKSRLVITLFAGYSIQYVHYSFCPDKENTLKLFFIGMLPLVRMLKQSASERVLLAVISTLAALSIGNAISLFLSLFLSLSLSLSLCLSLLLPLFISLFLPLILSFSAFSLFLYMYFISLSSFKMLYLTLLLSFFQPHNSCATIYGAC